MAEFRYFDHTADIGMEVEADDLESLFATALEGLARLLVPDANRIDRVEQRSFRIAGDDLSLVLFDLLAGILDCFEEDGFVPAVSRVTRGDNDWIAELEGERFDPRRHPMGHEVKSITYHQLAVEQQPDGLWRARIIFDI